MIPIEWYEIERNNDDSIAIKAKVYINQVREERTNYTNSSTQLPNANNANAQKDQFKCETSIVCECGFYVCNTHQIYSKKGVWYAAARCGKYPIITINPKKHYSNEE